MADVRMPDGTIVRNVPDGITKSQLMARYGKAKPNSGRSGIGWLDKTLSIANEAVIGGVEGVYNAASAVTDPIAKKVIDLIQGPEAAEQAMRQANAGRRSISDAVGQTFVSRPTPVARDIGRVVGAMIVPLPGKKLQEGGKIAKAAYRAMQGAVGGAAVRDVDEDAATPAAIGAATNVVLPPFLSMLANTRAGQAVGSAAASVAKPVTNFLGKLTGLSEEAAPALLPRAARPLQPLGRKAEARAARFQKLGVDKPTTGMVTRDPNAFSFERNTASVQGAGEELQQQIHNVEEGLVAKGREIVGKQGGSKGAEATGKAVQDAEDAKRTELQQATSKLYEDVREKRGDEVVGRLDTLRERMTDPDMVDNAVFDQMREGVMRRLERLGVVGKGGSLSNGVTVRQAEEMRKFIGALGSNAEPGVRMARRNLIEALDDDVVGAIGDDAFKEARASAKARFGEFKKTFAGKIADEGIAPERLTKRILSDTTSLADLRSLRESLLSGTEEQIVRGKEAWQGLRAQALDDLLSRSANDEGKLLGGQLARDFVRQSAKFRELLEPRDYVELRRLVLASRDATVAPPGSSVNHSNTATTLANMFQASKPKVRESWLKFLTKHSIAAVTSAPVGAFPYANIALEAGTRAAGSVAERKAAELLLRRVKTAQSPEETAVAIAAMEKAADSDPIIKGLVGHFFERHGMAGNGGARGAVAGAVAQ